MAGTAGKKKRKKRARKLIIVNVNAAGIDLGSTEHYVAVPPGRDPEGEDVRHFPGHTPGLRKMADWLKECKVETVAMESTGVYWIPAFEILEEAGLEVVLVHAGHLKYVPGRKSDVMDCEWIQQVHTYGLLSGCFRPENEIILLRTLVRHRNGLVEEASHFTLHMQKALDQMNVLVHRAVSDITGKTGMGIIRAIVGGNHDPLSLATYRDPRCQKTPKEIADALSGNFRKDYLFTLKQALESYDHIQKQIEDCDLELEEYLQSFQPKIDVMKRPLPKRKGKRHQGNEPKFELRTALYQMSGVDLTQVEGVQAVTALKVLSEIGTDMTPWPTVGHFCSWLGLCSGSRVTGGKSKGGKTRKVVNKVAIALRMAASTLKKSQGPLGHFYRKMKRNLDKAQVVTAVAHKLARIIYSMLKSGTAYSADLHVIDPEVARKKTLKRMLKNAQKFGYTLVNLETGEAGVAV